MDNGPAVARSLAPAVTAATAIPWYRTITREQWRVLVAAKFGWMLDAMDFMLYAMAIGQLRTYFGFNDTTAGMLGTVTLVMSGVGGTIFGYVADRFGRTRALMGTILIFSLASLGAATSQSVIQLLFWRAILGIGMGGVWSAGMPLAIEHWPPQVRGIASGLLQGGYAMGYILSATIYQFGYPLLRTQPEGWRVLLWIGILPALLALWVMVYVKESPIWLERRRSGARRAEMAFRFLVCFRAISPASRCTHRC